MSSSTRKLNRNIKQSSAGRDAGSPASIFSLIMNIVTAVYTIALFILLPLCFNDHYYDIGDFKFKLFNIISSSYVIIMTILMLPYIQSCIKSRRGMKSPDNDDLSTDGKRKNPAVKFLLNNLNVVDWFVVAYALLCLISFVCSEFRTFNFFMADPTENGAWYGFPDWFMGSRSQLLFIMCYFYVSRFFSKKTINNVFVWISLASALVFLFGVLHRLEIDPLGFYKNLTIDQKLRFLSTLGQASWYSAYLSTILPLGIGLYFLCKETWSKVPYLPLLVLGFMSLVSQNSDSAYFALFAVLVTLFMFAFKDNSVMKNYIEILIIFILSARFMGVLMDKYALPELELDTISLTILHSGFIWIILAVLIIVYAALIYNDKKGLNFEVKKIELLRWVVLGLSALFFIGSITMIILFTKGSVKVPENMPLSNYFIFDTNWGNGRGGTWMLTKDMFKSFKPLYKLFGCGSDCYGYYAYTYMSEQASALWGSSFIANAHNEWYNMLINGGFLGGAAYLGIFISAFVVFLKKRDADDLVFASALCIISYVFHGFFCYQTCLNTPFILCLIALGVWSLREKT